MKKNYSARIKGLLLGFLGVLILTPDSMLLKLAALPYFDLVFFRGIFLIPTLCFLLYLQERKMTHIIKLIKTKGKHSIVTGFFIFISSLCFILSIVLTNAANTLIVISMAPLATAFFSWIFLKEKPTLSFILATSFCLIGSSIMFSASIDFSDYLGIGVAFISITFLAFQLIWIKSQPKSDSVIGLLIGAIMTFALSWIFIDQIPIVSTNILLIMAIDATIVGGLSFLLIFKALKYISASYISLFLLIETILGPIWVYLALNELPSQETFYGGIFIFVAILGFLIYQMKQIK